MERVHESKEIVTFKYKMGFFGDVLEPSLNLKLFERDDKKKKYGGREEKGKRQGRSNNPQR